MRSGKMSEKRFECVFKEHETKNSWSMIKDNQLDKSLYIKDVVDLLNEQQATIKQLESDKAIAEDYANIFEKENVKLRIENKKLKEENEQLRNELDKYKIVILQFVGLLVENGIIDSSVKEEVDELLEELSGDGV